MKPFVVKPRVCAQCQTIFTPMLAMAKVCSPSCAIRFGKARKAKEKVALKERKAALKRIPDLIKEAQIAFNAFIRERDRDQPCISCDVPLPLEALGGGYDCGHYRSTGSASHLRFNEDNAHGQCKRCNRWGAGKAVDYRLRLGPRIGLDRCNALESTNDPHKWTREELIAIRKTYQAKLKELKAS